MPRLNTLHIDNLIEKMQPREKRYQQFFRRFPGLGIRVYPSGRKKWVLQSKVWGSENQTLVTLGDFPALSFDMAARLARPHLETMGGGQNPNILKEESKGSQFGRLVDDYVNLVLPQLRTGPGTESVLRREWCGMKPVKRKEKVNGRTRTIKEWVPDGAPIFRDRPVKFIRKQDIIARLDAIRAERGRHAARAAMCAVRSALGWAARDARFGLSVSPAAGLRDQSVGLSERDLRRDRVPSDSEVRAIWRAAGDMGVFGSLVKMLMLTACRRDEIALARWSEIVGDVLVIPASGYKTKREHRVYLSPDALDILDSLRGRFPDSPFIFSKTGRHGWLDFTTTMAALRKASNVPDFRLHDLRRVVRTNLSAMRVPRDVSERVLGHVVGGIEAVYNRYEFEPEQREALNAWAARLAGIVAPPPPPPAGQRQIRLVA